MTMWVAIGLVAAGSYVLRLAPLLLPEHRRLSQRAETVLRHAATGAMTALLVLDVRRTAVDASSSGNVAFLLALVASGTLAALRRSMLWVVLCGVCTYGAALGLLHALAV